MPHFGILDESAYDPVEVERMRARVHIRAGRRLLTEGKVRDGLSALFDALMSSLRWYEAKRLGTNNREIINERNICASLQRTGFIDGSFDFDGTYDIIEGLIDGRLQGVDHKALAAEMESVMESLGVIPFDPKSLPPEKRGGEG